VKHADDPMAGGPERRITRANAYESGDTAINLHRGVAKEGQKVPARFPERGMSARGEAWGGEKGVSFFSLQRKRSHPFVTEMKKKSGLERESD